MARVVVHLYGRAKDESARRLIEDYQARIGNRGISVKVHSEKSLSTEDYERLLLDLGGELILLDESGNSHSSVEFAKKVASFGLGSNTVNLAVGPTDGFSEGIKSTGQELLSLSNMTFPHELTAVILLEQLYRAMEINRGSPYHRG